MTQYIFEIKEASRGGNIVYDAVEPATGTKLQLAPGSEAGRYPEIGIEMTNRLGRTVTVIFMESLGDTFDQATHTFRFPRGADEIVVKDIVRTALRATLTWHN